MTTNLLFITTDQQRWDSLPCYGLDFMQTPNLDRLAREGLVFERCIVPGAVCVPCRAAIMTGQYPSTTGVLNNGSWLRPETPTWPARLTAAGRRTAAIGKMHFYPWDTLGGFAERIIAEDKRHVYLPDDHVQFLRQQGLERPHPTTDPGYFESLGAPIKPWPKHLHIDAFVGDQAAMWLERNGHAPFAVWVSFPGPHDPYDPPQELATMYDDAPIPAPIGAPAELINKPPAQRSRGAGTLNNAMFQIDPSQATPEQYRRWRAHYYANISLIDEGIGKILAALERVDALDKTLIIFTSDHGDALGDHGLAYKGFFYDSMVHVPLILRGPGVPVGQRCASLVSTLDLIPLFFQTCGVEPPSTVQGEDIGVLLRDPNATLRQAAFCELTGRAMVQTDGYKYARYADGSAELYDLHRDPAEIQNLAGKPDQLAVEQGMQALLLNHWLTNQRQQAAAMEVPQHPLRMAIEEEYRQRRTQSALRS
ncbi:MAG: sulfatase-like hydrolase/transferase [Caldilineaceae bacterium]